ncbi:hypothetical protein [Streptomyces sp. NPDC058291]|uniref:hypothetical protein n=1 Tax=Streptomyces sp. NPDC058291 TaxID=3346427 RepID=UPI0036F129AF
MTENTSPEPQPATDRTALRDQIAEALRYWVHPTDRGTAAEAVLAALPEQADRAAVLREAAEHLEAVNPDRGAEFSDGVDWAVDELRRMAAECPQCGDAGACNGGPCRLAAEPAAAGPDQTDDETQAAVRCSAAAFKRPHGPHSWEPQPGMDPVRCPGACRCNHPDAEHSVYGCADGCPCEYLPARKKPAVGGAQQPKEARP